jgi:hypothetical protein
VVIGIAVLMVGSQRFPTVCPGGFVVASVASVSVAANSNLICKPSRDSDLMKIICTLSTLLSSIPHRLSKENLRGTSGDTKTSRLDADGRAQTSSPSLKHVIARFAVHMLR